MEGKEDIVPELLENIREEFQKNFGASEKIRDLYKKIQGGSATYKDAYEFAENTGSILAQSFGKYLSSSMLPEGRMYYNIADRILRDTLRENYDLITDVTSKIQKSLNKNAGIGIKPIVPELNQDRIDGLVNKISSAENYDDVAWVLDEPVKTFSLSVVDDSIKKNAEFHSEAGLSPKIIRKSESKCCKWCRNLVGSYTYPDNVPDDVYRRHENCRCTVDYHPGAGRIQNVHSKQWQNNEEKEKIEIRKDIGIEKKIRGRDVTKEYISNATPNKGNYILKNGYIKELHNDEIDTANLIYKILGGDIELLPEANVDNVKTADYIWNGKYWDLKSTSTAKSANSAIRHGLQQIKENPGGIILNYRDNKIAIDEVIEVIEKRMQWSKLEQVDIMIVSKNKIEKILRYK